MAQSLNKFDVYLETGKKRTFAGAIDCPGWCRSGRDEASALIPLRLRTSLRPCSARNSPGIPGAA